MRYIFVTIASLLLAAATAPILAQQSSLTMVRNVERPGFTSDTTKLPFAPVHFLRDSGIDIIQQNGYASVQANNSHPQPIHFLKAYSHTPAFMLPSLMPPYVQRIYALRAARHRKLRH